MDDIDQTNIDRHRWDDEENHDAHKQQTKGIEYAMKLSNIIARSLGSSATIVI
jgi:hypothetical protein